MKWRVYISTQSNSLHSNHLFQTVTTFSPNGKLPQLSHAIKATTLGAPIVAVRNLNGITLASLQTLPSPLMIDNGTPTFFKITNSIVLGHTGVNADGRVVANAAQRLAVEHAFTFQEEIPINVLLEELALLFQDYTMKAGVRPFGCSIVVASASDGIFAIDPAGTVTKVDQGVLILGKGNNEENIGNIQKVIQDHHSLQEMEKILAKVIKEDFTEFGVLSNCQSVIIASASVKDDKFRSSKIST